MTPKHRHPTGMWRRSLDAWTNTSTGYVIALPFGTYEIDQMTGDLTFTSVKAQKAKWIDRNGNESFTPVRHRSPEDARHAASVHYSALQHKVRKGQGKALPQPRGRFRRV